MAGEEGEFPEQVLNSGLGNLVAKIEYNSNLKRGLCSYHLQLRAFLFNWIFTVERIR